MYSSHPSDDTYPKELELFTKNQMIGDIFYHHIQYITNEKDYFLAIVMEHSYYEFLIEQKIQTNGITHIDEFGIISLKEKAFINNLLLYNKGVTGITKRKVRKHFYDIVHIILYIRQTGVILPHDIYHDCRVFIEMIKKND